MKKKSNRTELLKQKTRNTINYDLMNIEENGLKGKENGEKMIRKYYPIGTKSDGQAIYLSTNDTMQYTLNNNQCINYTPRNAKKSKNSRNNILPQRCIEISLYNIDNKKIEENEIINFIDNPKTEKNIRPRNIIKVNLIKNNMPYKYLTTSNDNSINKSNIPDDTKQKKITEIHNSRNQNKGNIKNKILQINRRNNSFKGIFSYFYDDEVEKEPIERRSTLTNPMNRSADFMKNPLDPLDCNYNFLRKGLKIFEDGKFINSMKNKTRKNGLINAIEKYKRYKSLSKLDLLNNNMNLSNNFKNSFNIKDITSKNNKKYKINNVEEENENEISKILNNKESTNNTNFSTVPNKENEFKNNTNIFSPIPFNDTEMNKNKIKYSFTSNNANKTLEKFNFFNKKESKKILKNINLISNNLDPVKISLNSNLTECKKQSTKNYLNRIVNTDSTQPNIKKNQDFNKEKSISLTDFNKMDINSTIKKINIYKTNNTNRTQKNPHQKTNINSSERKILLDNKIKNTYSLTNIFSTNNNNQTKAKNNTRKFYIRKLLREEHYYIDENGKEKVFEVTQSLINNNDKINKNPDIKNTPIKNYSNNSKNTQTIFVNRLNNKQSIFKNSIFLTDKKKYNDSTLTEKKDNQNNINIHNNTIYLIRNISQIQPKDSNVSTKNISNANNNVHNNVAYQKKNNVYYKDNYKNNTSILDNDKIESLKFNGLIKKKSFLNNHRYMPSNYINNRRYTTRTDVRNKEIKDNNNLNKNRKTSNSNDYFNHSYYEVRSTSKQNTDRVNKSENESKDIFADSKLSLNKNQFLFQRQSPIRHLENNRNTERISNKNENKKYLINNKNIKGIGNLDFSPRGIENKGNTKNIYTNYKIYISRGISNNSSEFNKNDYYNTDCNNKGINDVGVYRKIKFYINKKDK